MFSRFCFGHLLSILIQVSQNRKIDRSILPLGKTFENEHEKYYDLLVPEHILYLRRRGELRILMSFNSGEAHNKKCCIL